MSGLERVRCAVTAAETGSQWWATAVRAQRETPSRSVDHGDLYGLAAELVATLHTLDGLAGVLTRQAARYHHGRVLRDDTGANPEVRLAEAADAANGIRSGLIDALRHANTYWSAIGHIAIDSSEITDEPPEGGRS